MAVVRRRRKGGQRPPRAPPRERRPSSSAPRMQKATPRRPGVPARPPRRRRHRPAHPRSRSRRRSPPAASTASTRTNSIHSMADDRQLPSATLTDGARPALNSMMEAVASVPPFESFYVEHRSVVLGFLRRHLGAQAARRSRRRSSARFAPTTGSTTATTSAWVLTIAARLVIDSARAKPVADELPSCRSRTGAPPTRRSTPRRRTTRRPSAPPSCSATPTTFPMTTSPRRWARRSRAPNFLGVRRLRKERTA